MLGALLIAAPALAGPSAQVKAAEKAMNEGRYEEAERLLTPIAERKEEFYAKMSLSRLKLRRGEYDAASLWVKRALGKADTDAQIAEAVSLRGLVEKTTGDYDAALRSWRRVVDEFPSHKRARLDLGMLLLEQGRPKEARPLLERVADDYNNSRMNSAAELTMVGLAVWKLEYYEDANSVLHEATEADPRHLEAYVVWGDLFLEKYSTDEAARTYGQALRVNPRLPEALLGQARIKLQQGTDLDGVRALIAKAREVNPNLPEAWILKAQLQIDEEDYDAAIQTLKKALAVNTNHLEARTLLATCHYLKDDTRAFEREERRVLRANPRSASFYTTVARFGARVHRYQEAIDLNLKALKVDPSYWPAFVELGIGYTRIGDDRKGFEFLLKAHENDPFNVRAFNMVNLYEKTMPEYTFVERRPLRFRFHRLEQPVLERVVVPLVEDAWASLKKRYHFTPKSPVNVEVFRSPETFSVRSVGLPHISPHGICFGRVVTARSPSSGDFNWAEVLWHEMAHVFHIQLSRSRVPRWFTEGLAEFEAGVARPEWRREQELELVNVMRDGRLLSVGDLNRGFTQAETLQDLIVAYFQSTLVIEYIVDAHGFDSVVKALKLYGESRTTPEVLKKITGQEIDRFDASFKKWLEARYARLLTTFEPSMSRYTDIERFKQAAADNPRDPVALAEHAAALYVARRIDEAERAWRSALKLDPNQPLAHYLAALYAQRTRDLRGVRRHLDAIVKAGHDGYSIRLQFGLLARREGEIDEAIDHFSQALAFYPRGAEAHAVLAELWLKQGDQDKALAALTEVTELSQSDFNAALRLMKLQIAQDDLDAALLAAERARNINPFHPEPHIALGQLALSTGKPRIARQVFETALELPTRGSQRAAILLGLARARFKSGDRAGARRALSQAREADPGHPELAEVKALVSP